MKVYRIEYLDGNGPYQNRIGLCTCNPIECILGECDCYCTEDDYCKCHDCVCICNVYEVLQFSNKLNIVHMGNHHPGWWLDFNIPDDIVKSFRSGCDSILSLKNWFHGFWSEMAELGFTIAVYEVNDDSDIYVSDLQVAFLLSESTVIDILDLESV